MSKKALKLVMPDGKPTDGAQNETEGETVAQEAAEQQNGGEENEQGGETPPESKGDEAQLEAHEIMQGISDSPEVCHALYQMLKDKYESQPTEEKEGPPAEYDMKGME